MADEERIQLKAFDEDSWPPSSEHDSFWGIKRTTHAWRPPTDVYETDDSYHVRVEIAGMKNPERVTALVKSNALTSGRTFR